MAIYRHHPCFIAFLCGNVLVKNRQIAKIGDFNYFLGLQNRGIGDKSRSLVTLFSSRQKLTAGALSGRKNGDSGSRI